MKRKTKYAPEFDSLVQVVDLKEEKIATTNDPSQ